MAMDSTAVGGESSQRGGLRASELAAILGPADGGGGDVERVLLPHKDAEKLGSSEPGKNLKRKAIDSQDSRRISREIDDLRSHLAGKMKELKYCEEVKKLRIELAQKAEENESLKKQNKELEAKSEISSQKNLLELEVTQLNDTIQLMKEDYEHMEVLVGILAEKERQINEELQQARRELVMVSIHGHDHHCEQGLEDMLSGRTAIGIKRMGELEEKSFYDACKRKYGNGDYETKAAELVSSWQQEMGKPSWHPFKIVMVDGEEKEVVDEDDAKLQHLLVEYGDDVRDAVKTAMCEMNEYNASGRYPVPEIWNFSIGRRATTLEAVQAMKKLAKSRRWMESRAYPNPPVCRVRPKN
uniref:Factor of DNA methylation 1-5/IDN2 domain-containing protein n=1 Tax=Oryza punctata TaxID=4537 RepID=A0A0E0JE07_ORYPU